MLKCFKNDSFCLYYPEDWELDEDDPQEADEVVCVNAPDSHGYVAVFRDTPEKSPEKQVEELLDAYLDDYKHAEVMPIEETLGGRVLKGFDIDFFYMDFPCIASIRALQHRDRVYVIVAQRQISENTLVEADFLQIMHMWAENLDKVGN